ncbi:hypothetical protein M8494_21820 [Serratia ureilytica]
MDGGRLRLIPTRSREGEGADGLRTCRLGAMRVSRCLRRTDASWKQWPGGSAEALARLRASRRAVATPLRQVRGLWVPQGQRIRRIVWRSPAQWPRAGGALDVTGGFAPCGRSCRAAARRLASCCWMNRPTDAWCAISNAWRKRRRATALSVGCASSAANISSTVCTISTSPGEWFSLLSYAHKPAGGRGFGHHLFVERVEPQDGNVFVIEWDAYNVGPDGRAPRSQRRRRYWVIAVSWRDAPLRLPTANNRDRALPNGVRLKAAP